MKKLKRFLLGLVLFALLPLPCWSDSFLENETEMIELTPEQWEQLKTNLKRLDVKVLSLENINQNQAQSLQNLNQSLTTANQSFTKLKKETQKEKIEIAIIAFSIGFIIGGVAGGVFIYCIN